MTRGGGSVRQRESLERKVKVLGIGGGEERRSRGTGLRRDQPFAGGRAQINLWDGVRRSELKTED